MFKQFIPMFLFNEDLLGGGGEPPANPDSDLGGGEPPAPPQAPEWLNGVPPELASDPSLGNIKDMEGLVKSFIHAQKLVGADKMVIPNKNSTDEDWKAAFKNLGMVDSLEDYAVNRIENSKLDEGFHKQFKEKAFELNVLPKQAQGLLDFYEELIGTTEANHIEAVNKAREPGIDALKEEWGDGYQRNLAAANYAIDNFGGDELRTHLKGLGLINDPQIAKMFAKIGEQMNEDEFTPGEGTGFGATPAQAQAKINEMLSDPNHPIHNPDHANHKLAQQEFNKLSKSAAKK